MPDTERTFVVMPERLRPISQPIPISPTYLDVVGVPLEAGRGKATVETQQFTPKKTKRPPLVKKPGVKT